MSNRSTNRLLSPLAGLVLSLCCSLFAAAPVSAQGGYTETQYPIVLVHGLFGFDSLLGGAVEYWNNIDAGLAADGATVHIVNVSASNSSEVRGEQLIDELEALQQQYGHSKFNLIGHSHGGPTVRYVASTQPALVASVTSVGSPHTGTPVADAVDAYLGGGPLTPLVNELVSAISFLLFEVGSGDDDPQDALAALASLNSAGATAFNAQYPEGLPSTPCGEGSPLVNGIRYYSFGGTSVLTNVLDPSDVVMLAGSAFFPLGVENDGLVGQCSSHLGDVIDDDLPWNHLDEVNGLLGLTGLLAPEPVTIYRQHANRLKNAGL